MPNYRVTRSSCNHILKWNYVIYFHVSHLGIVWALRAWLLLSPRLTTNGGFITSERMRSKALFIAIWYCPVERWSMCLCVGSWGPFNVNRVARTGLWISKTEMNCWCFGSLGIKNEVGNINNFDVNLLLFHSLSKPVPSSSLAFKLNRTKKHVEFFAFKLQSTKRYAF